MQSASEETSTAKKANDDAVKAQNGQDYSRSRADQQTAAANDEAKAKLANTAPVAKAPAATAAQLPQTGERTLSQASWQAFFLCWPEFLSLASALRKESKKSKS
ncbi:MAG: hypothetical protein ACTIBA_00525 [Lactobacillus delbrueckii]|uniref:Uncharacterized protein n=1 Tax=Lactobacillus delbrueckii subsp. bulgaricus TaxID=1585 RepID=A0AAV5PFJ5_LACDE|nr:hypothetical protein [Lactobacillus delbrueckii]ADY85894.1 Hypothetical protein LBU_1709 [Lactobacillus delbrueckii subsp. bulgaricus 2038]AYC66785.1 hypothetical protein D4Z81_05580 [Lactobacillus delbrueckii subsp. bulgaricus]EHE86887.1 hypothetical protein LDBUL1519_01837 [Lactobacillus delbrueckii subsp. bulgaricus CNCM I-1519]MCD5449449.1 hypothetical protein [Lactobacillus delbrueckii subsp. bulgaricus]MCD5455047.1 hypothetical protein [Lactobacillus delbrueckii subsp. bulgaricus]